MTESDNAVSGGSSEDEVNNKRGDNKVIVAFLIFVSVLFVVGFFLSSVDDRKKEKERIENEIASLNALFQETVDVLHDYDGTDGKRVAEDLVYVSQSPYRSYYLDDEEKAAAINEIGNTWLNEIDRINDDFEEARRKFQSLKLDFESLEKEGEENEYLMLDIGRQFGVRGGYAQYEAVAVNKGKKVVLLVITPKFSPAQK
ncbi:hypothetical protein [Alcanivorax sp.]|uniref:hypothetical protein n=1 Tax=Alcanivorax sp. TaxID=1872427 RepID=UPI0025BDBB2F|nr:hypothetical protein [Alcanivorax sp.]